jgi:hypothetical protein
MERRGRFVCNKGILARVIQNDVGAFFSRQLLLSGIQAAEYFLLDWGLEPHKPYAQFYRPRGLQACPQQ